MSGGSYDYLYLREPHELMEDTSDVEAVAERLLELDAADAAKDAFSLIAQVTICRRDIAEYMQRLSGVFKAVEWMDSGDIAVDQFDAAVTKYRQTKNAPPAEAEGAKEQRGQNYERRSGRLPAR